MTNGACMPRLNWVISCLLQSSTVCSKAKAWKMSLPLDVIRESRGIRIDALWRFWLTWDIYFLCLVSRGYTATNLQEHTIFKYANYIFAQSASVGAEPTVLAATDPNAKPNGYAGPNGLLEFWGHAKWGCTVNKAVWDTSLQDSLWEKCEELTHSNMVSRLWTLWIALNNSIHVYTCEQ